MAGHRYHTAGISTETRGESEVGRTNLHLADAASIAGLAQPRFMVHPRRNGPVEMTGVPGVRS